MLSSWKPPSQPHSQIATAYASNVVAGMRARVVHGNSVPLLEGPHGAQFPRGEDLATARLRSRLTARRRSTHPLVSGPKSSGGGTRTHNLSVNSRAHLPIELPRIGLRQRVRQKPHSGLHFRVAVGAE